MSGPAGPHRREMIASTIERSVQTVLARGLSDPRIKGLITVTGVKVSRDKGEAEVRVSVFPREHEALTMHGLRSAAEHIRREISGAVRLRRMPTLRFKLDESLKRQAEVFEALAREPGKDLPATGSMPDAAPEHGSSSSDGPASGEADPIPPSGAARRHDEEEPPK